MAALRFNAVGASFLENRNMGRVAALVVGLGCLVASVGLADDKKTDRKPGPAVAKLIEGGVDVFIKHFDKDQDGYLSKSELPPALQARFTQFDKNGDGKLDKDEVAQML